MWSPTRGNWWDSSSLALHQLEVWPYEMRDPRLSANRQARLRISCLSKHHLHSLVRLFCSPKFSQRLSMLVLKRRKGLSKQSYSRTWNVDGAWKTVKHGLQLDNRVSTLTEYQSLRVKVSCALFFRPFFPLDNRLFLTQQLASRYNMTPFWKTISEERTDFPTAIMAKSSELLRNVDNVKHKLISTILIPTQMGLAKR